MNPAFGALAWSMVVLCGVTVFALSLYLEFRIQARIDLGELPADTPRLFKGWAGFFGVSIGLHLPTLFSRRLLEVDTHTRRFVPVIRAALLLLPVSIIIATVAD